VVSVKGSLVLAGTANSPVRIYCPSNATISIKGKMKAAHLVSSGSGGILFTGAGGSCVLDNIEINGYADVIYGYLSSITIRNAVFTDNDAVVSLAQTGDYYTSNVPLTDLMFSGVKIAGGGRLTGTGLIINGTLASNANIVLQQSLFSNLLRAVSYTVPTYAYGTHFIAVNVTVKNCIDGFAPQTAQSAGFDTMIVSSSDMSTRNPAVSLDSAQTVNLLMIENSNILSKTEPPLKVANNALTSIRVNQAAVLDKFGKAYSITQVYQNIADINHFEMLQLDSFAIADRGMGFDFVDVDTGADTTTIVMVPDVPSIISATESDGSITVSWLSSTEASSYNLYYAPGDTVIKNEAAVISVVQSPKTISGLANGVKYTFAVSAVNNHGESDLSDLKSAIPLVKPQAPLITAAIASDGAATITWNTVPTAEYYNLYFQMGTNADTLSAKYTKVTSPKTVTGLTNGVKYTFAISAINNIGESDLSAVDSVTPFGTLNAPVLSSVITGDGSVSLSWGLVAGALSYNIYYTTGTTVSKTDARITGATNPKMVTGLVNGTQYAFAISVSNGSYESDLSPVSTATPHAAPVVPAIPSDITTVVDDGLVTINWGVVTSATSYKIYYAKGSTVDKTGAAFSDTVSPKTISGLSNGMQYAFAVTAVNTIGESELSEIKTVIPMGILAAPGISSITSADGSITLSWGPVSGAASYNVYYAIGTTVNKNDAKIANVTSPKAITGLVNGTQYAFAVSAANGSYESDLSTVSTVTPHAAPVVPQPPANIAATAGNGSVSIVWSAVAGALSYKVYFSSGTTVDKTGASFTNASSPKIVQGLSNGTVYAFTVSAVNAAGESDMSQVVTAPGTPVISSIITNDSIVTVNWSPVALATSYNLYYAAGSAVDRTGLKIVSVTSPYTVRALTNGTLYAFAVAAANQGGESSLSTIRTATPGIAPPSAPVGVSAVAANDGEVSIQWSPVSGAVSYNIYYAQGTTVDKTGTKVTGVTSPKTIEQLTNKIVWAFCVTAVNAGGESAVSTVVTATPQESSESK
jgi:hypothetical protein